MRRKIGFLTLSLLWACIAQAGPVKKGDAAQKASQFLGKKVVAAQQQANEIRGRSQASPSPTFYVFNAEDGKGFVIISGDDQMPEVVGYSTTNSFDITNMHPGLADMLDFYNEAVNNVRKGIGKVPAPRRSSKVHLGVEPLLGTSWGQTAPYNNLCPLVGEQHCVTGCVSTAMSQVMYYYQWPQKGTGTAFYAHPTHGTLTSNIGEHTYNYAAMKPTTTENLASDEAAQAVAQLCYDCGVAVQMDYGLNGSGALETAAMTAFIKHFGYRASTMEQKDRSVFDTQEEWDNLIKSELDAKRPVFYSGRDYYSGGGHEFLIDGYDEEGNFHVNWGWHGAANDGYYSILTLDPRDVAPTMSYSLQQTMVIGIMPDPTGLDKHYKMFLRDKPSVSYTKLDLGTPFLYNYGTFINWTAEQQAWTINCALYNLEGEQLKLLANTPSTYEISSLSGFTLSNGVRIPEDTPDGFYTLRTVFKLVEKDAADHEIHKEFILPFTGTATDINQVYVQVADGVVYFNVDVNSDLELSLAKGWNWISHNVATALNPFELFGENVVEVKSQTKGIVRDGKYGMVGNLTAMDATAAYKVKTIAADTHPYILTGYLFNARQDALTLKTGWNWIGYPLPHAQTLSAALQDFTPQEGDLIVGQDTFAEYADGAWTNPDFVLTPGLGYLYKSGADAQLLFHVGVTAEAKQRNFTQQVQAESHWHCDKHRYPNVLPLTASISLGKETADATRYDVAAFCGDECRGVGQVSKNRVMMNVYGQGGETITFLAFDKETGEILSLEEQISFVPDVLSSFKAPYLLTLQGEATSIATLPQTQQKDIIYNLAGQRMGTTTQSLPAGTYIRNGKKIFVQ